MGRGRSVLMRPSRAGALRRAGLTGHTAAGLMPQRQASSACRDNGAAEGGEFREGRAMDVSRRDMLIGAGAAAASFAFPGGFALAQAKKGVLRVVPHANLQILDP